MQRPPETACCAFRFRGDESRSRQRLVPFKKRSPAHQAGAGRFRDGFPRYFFCGSLRPVMNMYANCCGRPWGRRNPPETDRPRSESSAWDSLPLQPSKLLDRNANVALGPWNGLDELQFDQTLKRPAVHAQEVAELSPSYRTAVVQPQL